MEKFSIKDLGVKVGLEIHQQLATMVQGILDDKRKVLLKNIEEMIEACKSPQDFFNAIELAMRAGAGEPTREVRRQLIRSIAFAQHDKNLAATLQETSMMGTQYLAETLAIAQRKGWLKNDIELTALSFWLQGIFIGQIMIDITDVERTDEEWVSIALHSLKTFINF